jgi:hypothetical protein
MNTTGQLLPLLYDLMQCLLRTIAQWFGELTGITLMAMPRVSFFFCGMAATAGLMLW